MPLVAAIIDNCVAGGLFFHMAESYQQYREYMSEAERVYLRAALDYCRWSIGAASRLVGLPVSSLRRRIDISGLTDEYRSNSPGRGRPAVE